MQGTDITTNAPCYVTGTRIATPRGKVPIEHLAIGDTVNTLSGAKSIRWIGRCSYGAGVLGADRDLLPVRIDAHAIEAGVQRRDLGVSPEHAMYLDGLLIPARALVNGTSIVQEEAVNAISYWHLEFDGHAVIHAEGAPAESYADDHSRAQPYLARARFAAGCQSQPASARS